MRIVIGLMSLFCFSVNAATIVIKDSDGKPLSDAVVWLTAKQPMTLPINEHYEIGQKDRSFVPHILPVPQGAKVDFPNFDSILHHVYSFSETNSFELKLYRDKPHTPITFEQSGIVELGCNIHDWMLGYIVVVDGPFFGVTDGSGVLSLTHPEGEYQLKVWHERFEQLDSPEALPWQLFSSDTQISYQVKQRLLDKVNHLADELDGY